MLDAAVTFIIIFDSSIVVTQVAGQKAAQGSNSSTSRAASSNSEQAPVQNVHANGTQPEAHLMSPRPSNNKVWQTCLIRNGHDSPQYSNTLLVWQFQHLYMSFQPTDLKAPSNPIVVTTTVSLLVEHYMIRTSEPHLGLA